VINWVSASVISRTSRVMVVLPEAAGPAATAKRCRSRYIYARTSRSTHPPLEGGSKISKRFLGWGTPTFEPPIATPRVCGGERMPRLPHPKICSANFDPPSRGGSNASCAFTSPAPDSSRSSSAAAWRGSRCKGNRSQVRSRSTRQDGATYRTAATASWRRT